MREVTEVTDVAAPPAPAAPERLDDAGILMMARLNVQEERLRTCSAQLSAISETRAKLDAQELIVRNNALEAGGHVEKLTKELEAKGLRQGDHVDDAGTITRARLAAPPAEAPKA